MTPRQPPPPTPPTGLRYTGSDKHKQGCAGNGPPRWFPTTASFCPDDVTLADSQDLLENSIEGRSADHPDKKGRYAIDGRGRFFKAYPGDDGATWHGYEVHRSLVPRQVPARVLRQFRDLGQLSNADYKDLLGSGS